MVTDKKPAWHDSAQIVPNEQNVRVQQSPNCNVGAIFWPPCVGPLLTKIHAREASRHVHAGALISVSSGGPEWNQLRGEHKVTQLALFRKICICNDYLRTLIKSTPTPPNSKGTVWESKSCQTVFTRETSSSAGQGPGFPETLGRTSL